MNEEFYKMLAEKIITHAFAGKFDKGGKPYIEHLYRVASKFDGRQEITALLHDLIEDCPEWNTKSLSALFPDYIVQTVDTITKRQNESYNDYLDRVSKCEMATEIKIADLEDNMNICRLPKLEEKDIERIKKYHTAYIFLKGLKK